MASTPPKVKGSPSQEQWNRWAEEAFASIRDGNLVRDTRVLAVTQGATNVGNLVADTKVKVDSNQDGNTSTAPTNRFPRPLNDHKYWMDITTGKQFLWNVDLTSTYEPGGEEDPTEDRLVVGQSTARNVTYVPAKSDGVAYLMMTPALRDDGTVDAAELDLTPMLMTPSSGKIYVNVGYPGQPALSPDIVVTVRNFFGAPLGDHVQPAPVQYGQGVVSVPVFDSDGSPAKYTITAVARETPAMIARGEIFEVIGGGNGVEIGPDGVNVTDNDGEDLVVINPNYRALTAPSKPILRTGLGKVVINWDGKSAGLSRPPANFQYLMAQSSDAETGPWVQVGQTINGEGEIIASPPLGQLLWYRFVAVDTLNQASPPSEPASIAAAGVEYGDLDERITDEITEAGNKAQTAMDDAQDALDAVADSIISVVNEYAVSASDSTAPTTGWSSAQPTRTPGTFIWIRVKTTKADSTVSTSAPALLTGNDGAPGTPGTPGGKGDKGDDGDDGRGVSSVTPYYRLVGQGSSAPAKPTTNPPPAGWTLTEPGYSASTELYRTELTLFDDATFTYSSVSKVSSYTASSQAVTVANLADAAAKGMVKAQQADPGHQVGRIWLVLNGAGNTVGIRISDGSSWSSYMLAADQLLVPSSVGNTLIADGAITTPKVAANSITANQVAIGDFTNLVAGSDFEDPARIPWDLSHSSFRMGSANPHTGLSYIIMDPYPSSRYATFDRRFEVQPGEQFYMELWARKVGSYDGTTANSKLSMRNGADGSPVADLAYPASIGSGWVRLSRTVTIPAGVTSIYFRLGGDHATGQVCIDDVVVRRMTTGSLIVDGAIDGKVITGATVRTAASGQRVQLDAQGLKAYNSSNSVTGQLSASSGGLTLSGVLRSGSGNQRAELVTDGLRFYASDGSPAGSITGYGGGGEFQQQYVEIGTRPYGIQVGKIDRPFGGHYGIMGDIASFTDLDAVRISASGPEGSLYATTNTGYKLVATSSVDASLTSTDHAIQVGYFWEKNLAIDNNEIMARDDGAPANLYLNAMGGNVGLGDDSSTVVVSGRLNAAHLPWAMASGVGRSNAGSGTSGNVYWDGGVTVTLPAGRFTQAPQVVTTPEYSGQVLTSNLISRTTSSFVVRTIRFGAQVLNNTDINWTAVQMSSGNAAG